MGVCAVIYVFIYCLSMVIVYNLLDFLAVSRETLKNTIIFCSECVPCTYFTSIFFRLSCLFMAFTGYIHAYGVIYTFIYCLSTFFVYNFLDFLPHRGAPTSRILSLLLDCLFGINSQFKAFYEYCGVFGVICVRV